MKDDTRTLIVGECIRIIPEVTGVKFGSDSIVCEIFQDGVLRFGGGRQVYTLVVDLHGGQLGFTYVYVYVYFYSDIPGH